MKVLTTVLGGADGGLGAEPPSPGGLGAKPPAGVQGTESLVGGPGGEAPRKLSLFL